MSINMPLIITYLQNDVRILVDVKKKLQTLSVKETQAVNC